MITLKLCYERRNDSAAFFNVQLEIAPLYCFAAILFVRDGGILYVKKQYERRVSMALSNLLNQYPPVLSVKQVAEILAVSHNTAYALVRSGQIHSVRVGRSYRVPLDAVIDYLRKH